LEIPPIPCAVKQRNLCITVYSIQVAEIAMTKVFRRYLEHLKKNNSEYPVKGRGSQTSDGEKVWNLKTVENGCDKKFIGDAW
jgi:hypothetical protein